jgi:ubiquinone/menaquinone biosynthesis C-methylase UbiE
MDLTTERSVAKITSSSQLSPLCLNKNSRHRVPEYLDTNYWWAYLSPIGVNFFDHPFIVNRILWGQYQQIAQDTVNVIAKHENETIAGISCAYGEFIPMCVQQVNFKQLALFDVAEIQLKHAKQKIVAHENFSKCHLFLSNAESIAMPDNSVDTSVLFYLLHELPEPARKRVLAETIRITKPEGRIIIADYAPKGERHFFHRNLFFRRIFQKMEPFLANFWRCDLTAELNEIAKVNDQSIEQLSYQSYWHQFYRLVEYKLR